MADKPSIQELISKAKEMQQKMQQAQSELSTMEIIGRAGDDTIYVEVTMNGRHEAKKTFISPAALQEQKEILEDLIVAAINDASHKIEKASQGKIMDLTQGMGLPTDLKLPEDEG